MLSIERCSSGEEAKLNVHAVWLQTREHPNSSVLWIRFLRGKNLEESVRRKGRERGRTEMRKVMRVREEIWESRRRKNKESELRRVRGIDRESEKQWFGELNIEK